MAATRRTRGRGGNSAADRINAGIDTAQAALKDLRKEVGKNGSHLLTDIEKQLKDAGTSARGLGDRIAKQLADLAPGGSSSGAKRSSSKSRAKSSAKRSSSKAKKSSTRAKSTAKKTAKKAKSSAKSGAKRTKAAAKGAKSGAKRGAGGAKKRSSAKKRR